MKRPVKILGCAWAILLFCLTGCASSGGLVTAPTVKLTSVELANLSFRQQTFLLGFDVHNPNPFPLPVRSVRYNLRLDGDSFAGGETQSDFSVPANGDDAFVISVDLDFMSTATKLASLIQGGMRDQVQYDLDGSFAVDIPFVRPVPFRSSGVIDIGR